VRSKEAVMDVHEAMARLEALGTEQNRKIYPRHGARPPMFGVSYADLGKLRKQLKTDHELALALWDTGNHDARVLATMIADPRRADRAMLDRWAASVDNKPLVDAFGNLAAAAPDIQANMARWIDTDHEWHESLGWSLLTHLANREPALPDSFFEPYIARIERDIHGAKNWVRYAMNFTLIAIGSRSDALEAAATAAAARIGKLHVDHGQTGCKTPDAASYIRKTRDHLATKAAKAARA
jgi:3-methyladenine DNA glycosylase AlkD